MVKKWLRYGVSDRGRHGSRERERERWRHRVCSRGSKLERRAGPAVEVDRWGVKLELVRRHHGRYGAVGLFGSRPEEAIDDVVGAPVDLHIRMHLQELNAVQT